MAIDPKVFKQVRKALGLTQEELADAIGLSRVTINKMERGKLARGIPDEIAARLMALKKQQDVKPSANVIDVLSRGSLQSWNPIGDEHLWDNEEDDQ